MFSLSGIIILSLLCTKGLGQTVYYVDEMDFSTIFANPVDSNTLVDFQKLYCRRLPNQGGKRFLTGSFTFKEDFDNSFSVKVVERYATTGHFEREALLDWEYNLQLCEFMHGLYKNFMHPSIENYSDFKINGDKTSCIIKAGTYHINDAPGDVDSLPGALHSGLHKVNLNFYKNDVNVGGFELLFDLRLDVPAK